MLDLKKGELIIWELISWVVDFVRIDFMRIDFMGVNLVRIDLMGAPRKIMELLFYLLYAASCQNLREYFIAV